MLGYESRKKGLSCGRGGNLRDDRGEGIGLKIAERGQRTPVLVASRKEKEQILHNKNAQASERLSPFLPHSAEETN